MIDLQAYISACSAPGSCFSAALAAFPSSHRAAHARAWWASLPAEFQDRLARGERRIDLAAVADAFGASPSPAKPTGYEIGVFQQTQECAPIFVVGAPGAWFARGKRRAVRLPRHLERHVILAWSVE